MSGLLFDNLTQGLQTVLSLRQKQHALTASNLANAETPGFRARVLDFEHSLQGAVNQHSGLAMERSHERHMRPSGYDRARIEQIEPTPWSSDGNSVVAEREQARLKHNSLMYRAVTTGLSRRLQMMKYAANDGS